MSKINKRQIQWNIENFDKIHVLSASVKNCFSQKHDQVLYIEKASSASCMAPITVGNQFKVTGIRPMALVQNGGPLKDL